MAWGTEMIQTITLKVREWIDNDHEIGSWVDSRGRVNYLQNEIEDAKNEWIQAQNFFQNVTDPDLIDYAIYLMEASEAKYSYLLKRARGFSKDTSKNY